MSGGMRAWMALWCAGVALFGVVLAAGGLPATDGPVRLILTLLSGGEAPQFSGALRFSLAVMGAVSIGWAITLWAAIAAAGRMGPAGAGLWRGVAASVLVWFLVDSALSVATGYWRNLIPNVLLLTGFFVPVWRASLLRS
jgi:hypothetical protein